MSLVPHPLQEWVLRLQTWPLLQFAVVWQLPATQTPPLQMCAPAYSVAHGSASAPVQAPQELRPVLQMVAVARNHPPRAVALDCRRRRAHVIRAVGAVAVQSPFASAPAALVVGADLRRVWQSAASGSCRWCSHPKCRAGPSRTGYPTCSRRTCCWCRSGRCCSRCCRGSCRSRSCCRRRCGRRCSWPGSPSRRCSSRRCGWRCRSGRAWWCGARVAGAHHAAVRHADIAAAVGGHAGGVTGPAADAGRAGVADPAVAALGVGAAGPLDAGAGRGLTDVAGAIAAAAGGRRARCAGVAAVADLPAAVAVVVTGPLDAVASSLKTDVAGAIGRGRRAGTVGGARGASAAGADAVNVARQRAGGPFGTGGARARCAAGVGDAGTRCDRRCRRCRSQRRRRCPSRWSQRRRRCPSRWRRLRRRFRRFPPGRRQQRPAAALGATRAVGSARVFPRRRQSLHRRFLLRLLLPRNPTT